MKYDIAIIGAGPSGLSAGIRLALFDKKVCVFERHRRIGGLNSFYRRAGRRFDVGLHSLTNYTPRGVRSTAWARILRQLRVAPEAIGVRPQRFSEIRFPGTTLRFDNDAARLEAEIAERFPGQADRFRRFVAHLDETNPEAPESRRASARGRLGEFVGDPLLVEMLLCPPVFYGAATEDDMDFGSYAILFRSIFLEGLGRPVGGAEGLWATLVEKYRSLGGELRLGVGVEAIADRGGGEGVEIALDSGETVRAAKVFSSAGLPETLALCGDEAEDAGGGDAPQDEAAADGRISFFESSSVLDVAPSRLGFEASIVFFNDDEQLVYRRPEGLIERRAGVVCCPTNFGERDGRDLRDKRAPRDEGNEADEYVVRVTRLANYERWAALGGEEYRRAKEAAYGESIAAVVEGGLAPDFRPRVVASDAFTPCTITRYASRRCGAVYGSPTKAWDGRTRRPNVFICGADQGFVGIVGAMLSGVTMANAHALYPG